MSPLKLGDFIQVYRLSTNTIICGYSDDGVPFRLPLFLGERAKEYYSYSVNGISCCARQDCLVLYIG